MTDMTTDDAILARLRTQAADGTPDALYRLGGALVVRQRVVEAFALYRRAAAAGHGGAKIEHARMLLYGVGTERNERLAVEVLLEAEQAGDPVASYFLALIAIGNVLLPRSGGINERMRAAVQHDYPPAVRAAALHFGRKPHEDDQTLCVRLLDRAATRGDVIAAQLLAERLSRGEGCDPQPEAAGRLWNQLGKYGIPHLPAVARPGKPWVSRGRDEMLPGRLDFEETLQAVPRRLQSSQPCVVQVDDVLSTEECRLLIASAQPHLRRSQTVDPATGQATEKELRTSSDCSFDPVMEDFSLRWVQLQLAHAAEIELEHAEQLIVLRYQPGQEYRPHRDYLPPGAIEADRPQAGNRRRSICTYLNHVEAGGETEFPLANNLRIAPAPGRAVVFDNLKPDGSPDVDSLHAGLPVLRGEKWLATLWLRERPYRAY